MKRIFAYIVFITTCTNLSFAQVKIGFAEPNQLIDLSKNYIELKLKIENSNTLKVDSAYYNLELRYSKTYDLDFFSIPKTKKKDYVVHIAKGDNNSKIQVSINVDNVKKLNMITLSLHKKGVINNLELSRKEITLVVKPEKKLISKLGFSKDHIKVSTDVSKNDFSIPFNLLVSGRAIEPSDNVSINIDIPKLNSFKTINYTKSVPFNSEGRPFKIKISKKVDYSGDFLETLDSIINITPLRVKATQITKTSENKLEFDKSKNTFLVDIKTTSSSSFLNDKQYNFYLGANFDLKDQLKANSFYSELDIFIPNIKITKSKHKIHTWGIRAGVYKNNNTTKDSISNLFKTVYTVENIDGVMDSLKVTSKMAGLKPTISSENLGLYFQILLKPEWKEKTHKNKNFKSYFSFHMEVIQRIEQYNYSVDELYTIDQFNISKTDLDNDRQLQGQLLSNYGGKITYFDSYFGIGYPMFFDNKHMSIFLNPTLGIGFPGRNYFHNNYEEFGFFQFGLIEKKYGIKISGGVRKYFNQRSDPRITINLSKSFNIKNMLSTK